MTLYPRLVHLSEGSNKKARLDSCAYCGLPIRDIWAVAKRKGAHGNIVHYHESCAKKVGVIPRDLIQGLNEIRFNI